MPSLIAQGERNSSLCRADKSFPAKILVVDDSAFQQRIVDQFLKEVPEWDVTFAFGGQEAITIAEQETPSIILTDLFMPDMDGLELLDLAKARLPTVPVILMTSYGSEEIAMKALRAGAANYIPKKALARDVVDTIQKVLSLSIVSRLRAPLMRCLQQRESTFQLEDNDTRMIPPLIQLIEEEIADFEALDSLSRIRIGVALQEALTNAYYHGNLEVSSELRQQDEKRYYELIDERRVTDPFASRRVTVTLRVDRKLASFTIRDEGPGFNMAQFSRPQKADDLLRIGGRGIFLIRTFMDDVQFNEDGNQITMTKHFAANEGHTDSPSAPAQTGGSSRFSRPS